MVRIDLARVVGPENEQDESSRGLLSDWINSRAKEPSAKPRPTRKLWYYFIAALLVLQVLVLWRFFFRPENTVAAGPPYDQDETVALVKAWYELLQDMRYLGRDMIAYPPHTGANAINITLAEHVLGLDEKVVETLLALPYVIPHEDRRVEATAKYFDDEQVAKAHEHAAEWWQGWMGQDHDILWRGGHFIDYRNDTKLIEARDPLRRMFRPSSERRPKDVLDHFNNTGNVHQGFKPLSGATKSASSRPPAFDAIKTSEVQPVARISSMTELMSQYGPLPRTAIALSSISHPMNGMSLILDTASNRILVLDSQRSWEGDPFFRNFQRDKIPPFYHIPRTLFYGKERDARLAPDFLRDVISQTAKLSIIPGSISENELLAPELSPPLWERWVRDMYRGLGWPKIEPLEECHWLQLRQPNNTCDHDPYEKFQRPQFDQMMKNLRRNITSRYMSDWYCPVPRDLSFIAKVQMSHPEMFTPEQLAYAESDEPVIPQNYEPGTWGIRYFWMSSAHI